MELQVGDREPQAADATNLAMDLQNPMVVAKTRFQTQISHDHSETGARYRGAQVRNVC